MRALWLDATFEIYTSLWTCGSVNVTDVEWSSGVSTSALSARITNQRPCSEPQAAPERTTASAAVNGRDWVISPIARGPLFTGSEPIKARCANGSCCQRPSFSDPVRNDRFVAIITFAAALQVRCGEVNERQKLGSQKKGPGMADCGAPGSKQSKASAPPLVLRPNRLLAGTAGRNALFALA